MPSLRHSLIVKTASALNLTSLLLLSQISLASLADKEIDSLVVSLQTSTQYVHLDAHLEAINQSTISAQTSGIVEAIEVDINDSVNAGQLLISINNSQQQAQLSQAQANLAQAQALNEDAQILLTRNRSLLAKKTLSQGEFDRSVAQAKSAAAAVEAAKAGLKQAKEQLSYTLITAPYAGIVKERMVEVGELVNPGQALMTGFALQPLRAVTHIPQHLIQAINQTQLKPSEIIIKANGQHYPASQFTLFPYADERYSSVQARVKLPTTAQDSNSLLLPGSWVEVALPIGQKNRLNLPVSAIIRQGEMAMIYVKTAQGFKLRYVRLGKSSIHNQLGQQVEVLSGLTVGEEVALNAIEAAMVANAASLEE